MACLGHRRVGTVDCLCGGRVCGEWYGRGFPSPIMHDELACLSPYVLSDRRECHIKGQHGIVTQDLELIFRP